MPRIATRVELPYNAKPWKDGLLYVTPDAKFYRKAGDGYTEVKKHLKERKTGPCWEVIYVDEKKRWISTMAHVVMADVYVDRPEGAKSVSMKDGDYLNLSLDNIIWPVSREYKREKKREQRKRDRYETLPVEFKKIPGRNAYITIEGTVAKKEKEGDYSIVKRVIQHNNTTDVYVVRLYDYETQKSLTVGVHTLLAETFLIDRKSEKDCLVSFKDGNGLNISLDNLYWAKKVNPIEPRKDVKERLTETLPVECKYVDGAYVSQSGRVFVMRENMYLELKHCDNGKNIIVNIPEENKGKYRIKKVANLVASAYMPPKMADEANELAFIDGDYRNTSVSNLIRRKLVYPPKEAKVKQVYVPEEAVFSCGFNDLYVSKSANVYVKREKGYKKVAVTRVQKPSGKDAYMVRYYDRERNKEEIIVLKKLLAYAFLKYNGKDAVVNANNEYNNHAIENLYLKPNGAKIYFIDHPAKETYNILSEGFVECDGLYINKEADVYVKKGTIYEKLVKYVIAEKGRKIHIVCRYISENNDIHYYDVAAMFEEAFNEKLCFNQKRKELFVKTKKTPSISKKRESIKERTYGRKKEEFVTNIGEDYTQAICNNNLWLNNKGEVYEFIPEKGYHKAKVSVEKKHGHPIAIVHYEKNEKGIYKHKGLDRLLAETFLWNEEGKCPHVIHKDGNYLNNSLDNLSLAGEKVRQRASRVRERKARQSILRVTPLPRRQRETPKTKTEIEEKRIQYKYINSLPDGYVAIPGKTYEEYFINPDGKVYKYDSGKGYREIEHSISEEGIAYIKVRWEIRAVGLLLAKAFIPNPTNALNWEPINGDVSDITLSNIRWRTNSTIVEEIPSSARKTYEDNIWVDMDETIYYMEDGLCKKVLKYTTTGKRMVVSICGKTFFPSRLIAEALVYNPYGSNGLVTFINGDTLDIRCANLKWVRQNELAKKGQEKAVFCSRCKERRVYKGKKYCAKCQRIIDSKQELSEIAALLREAPNLSESQSRMIDLYEEGKNISEIAAILGISRQAAHKKFNSIRRRADRLTERELIAEEKLKSEIKEKYDKLKTSVSLEEYEKIYRLACSKENSPVVIAKRVVKRIDNNIDAGKSIEEMVEMEDQLLSYQRAMRNNQEE